MLPLRDILPSRTTPVLTMAFIAINVGVYLVQWTLPPRDYEAFILAYGFIPAEMSVPTAFSSMFVHGGLGHLSGNMLYLWIFGDNVEDRMGHGRFIVFYLLCGLAATAAQTFTQPASPVPMVGASGAISGVLGAYLLLFPHSRVLTLVPPFFHLVELPAMLLLGVWFLMQLLSGVGTIGADLTGGVAFWAHAGGFLAGMLLVGVFKRPERMQVDWWDHAARR